jgi:hypothetical protein
MKIQIRKGIFETNSSSSHSLIIRRGEHTDTDFFKDKNNNITLKGGQFGWGEGYEYGDRFFDAETKANYVAVGLLYLINRYKNPEYEGDRNIPKDVYDKYLEHLDLLTEVIKEYTNCNEVIYEIITEYDRDREWSYIDHQSSDYFLSALESKDTLIDFIFNPNSELIIDNDNH